MKKYLDLDGVQTLWNKSLDKFVAKITGKGLSTNDYTDADKSKLTGIAAGAEVNVQSDWDQADTAADDYIKHKPTALSEFTNDTLFVDSTVDNLINYYLKTEVYTQTEVNTLISNIVTFDIQVVATLPTENISTHTIYLVPHDSEAPEVYTEYIYVNSAWETIGTTQVDLSNYYNKTAADVRFVAKETGKSLMLDTEISRLADVHNYDDTDVQAHMADTDEHVTAAEKTTWNEKADATHTHVTTDITDFPTALPADGGDADTVGGKYITSFDEVVAPVLSTGTLLAWFNASAQSVSVYSTYIPEDAIANYEGIYAVKKFSNIQSKIVLFYSHSSSKVYIRMIAGNTWVSEWQALSDNGNADTLDTKHASDFVTNTSMPDGTSANSCVGAAGKTSIYQCAAFTDVPAYHDEDTQGTIITINYDGTGIIGTNGIWAKQLFICPRDGSLYSRFVNDVTVSDWVLNAESADGTTISSNGGVLSANYSNDNLLDNPNGVINQRGGTSYSGSNVYTVDRWYTGSAVVTVNDDCLTVAAPNAATTASLRQKISRGAELAGKTITASVDLDLITEGSRVCLQYKYNGAWTPAVYETQTGRRTITRTVTLPDEITTDIQFAIMISTPTTAGVVTQLKLYSAKIEIGGAATPFFPPDPATELIKCQRYYQTISTYVPVRAAGIATNTIDFNIPIATSMRIIPTIIGTIDVESVAYVSQEDFTLAVNTMSAGCICIRATKTAHGLTDAVARATTVVGLSADI